MLLDKISTPADLRRLDKSQLPQVARELRDFVLKSVSQTGGHLSSNLGTIELTIDKEIYVLHGGDGYYFPSTLPHRFRNIGQDEAEIISSNSPANF